MPNGIEGTPHQGVEGAPGVSHKVKGDVRGIQGGQGGASRYPRGSRRVLEVEGSLGDPKG